MASFCTSGPSRHYRILLCPRPRLTSSSGPSSSNTVKPLTPLPDAPLFSDPNPLSSSRRPSSPPAAVTACPSANPLIPVSSPPPPPPPESVSYLPPSPSLPLINQIHAFVRSPRVPALAGFDARAHHVFPDVSVTAYNQLIRKLAHPGNLDTDFARTARIDYFCNRSVLVITLPGKPHEVIAVNSQIFLRQTLFEQGFYWPSWGSDIERIHYTGTTNRSVGENNGRQSSFQPDGSLEIKGQSMPFMVIEVADTETYDHARMKAWHLLKYSKGKIRFVVIIDLVRQTVSARDKGNEHQLNAFDNELKAPRKHGVPDSDPLSNPVSAKKLCVDGQSASFTVTPAPGTSGTQSREESPLDSPTLPPLLSCWYSCATVSVLTSTLTIHPHLPNKRKRVISTIVNAVECWPQKPGPESTFSFTWDDMNVADYPSELQGKKYTISWGWLHELLVSLFSVADDVPRHVEDDEDVVDESSEPIEADLLSDPLSSGKAESDDNWVP